MRVPARRARSLHGRVLHADTVERTRVCFVFVAVSYVAVRWLYVGPRGVEERCHSDRVSAKT